MIARVLPLKECESMSAEQEAICSCALAWSSPLQRRASMLIWALSCVHTGDEKLTDRIKIVMTSDCNRTILASGITLAKSTSAKAQSPPKGRNLKTANDRY